MIGKFHNAIRRFCGWLLGTTFVLSGIFKLMDPVGTSFIVTSYLNFLHIGFLRFAAGFLAWGVSMLETTIGIALVTGIWRRLTGIVTSITLGFFTLLTLLLLIFNPDMDCGCFGEVVHLTHIQSFLKNIVFCILACAAFLPLREMGTPAKMKYVSSGIVFLTTLAFSFWSMEHIGLKDFTPFAPGNRILAAANESDGNFEFDATFVYSKDGVEQSFTLENLPDSTWTYVRTETVEEQVLPEFPILSFTDADGEYRDYLAASGRVMVISVYKPERLSESRWARIDSLLVALPEYGFRPLLMVAGETSRTDAYKSDYKTLATLNRTNGGATWLDNGFIVRKFSGVDLPDQAKLKSISVLEPDEAMLDFLTKSELLLQGFLLYVFAVLFLL